MWFSDRSPNSYTHGRCDITEKTKVPPSAERDQAFYAAIKRRFAEERDLRLAYRPEGTAQFTSDFTGALAKYAADPFAEKWQPRERIEDTVEVAFIGGGFSALLTSARLRERGVENIRIIERGSDVGGTWYWNRYPGAACDVESYDYLPLLDEMDYVPKDRYAKAPEIMAHCQAIARRYNLYELAVFQTTVTSTLWNDRERLWHLGTDRGDLIRAQFVVCANGTLSKPKLARIDGLDTFAGHSFHTSRWDYDYTGEELEQLEDKVVGIIGTGATAVQAIPQLGATAKTLYVFQRTPSSIDIREDWPTDPNWARRLKPGWQARRRDEQLHGPGIQLFDTEAIRNARTSEEKVRLQEQANIDYMIFLHERIEAIVKDQTLVYVHVQAPLLPRGLSVHIQPPQRASGGHPRQGHHPDHAGRPGVRPQGLSAGLADLRDRL